MTIKIEILYISNFLNVTHRRDHHTTDTRMQGVVHR